MSKAKEQTKELTYEKAISELESIIAKMETSDLPMDDMLKSYKRATELLAYCKSQIVHLEDQVKLIDSSTLPTLNGDN